MSKTVGSVTVHFCGDSRLILRACQIQLCEALGERYLSLFPPGASVLPMRPATKGAACGDFNDLGLSLRGAGLVMR